MTEQERSDLQANFIAKTVQDMDEMQKDMFICNVLSDSYYQSYTDEQFVEEVRQYFPELLA